MDMQSHSARTRTRAFTLLELLATIAIAAIVLTVVVPGFTTVVQNNRLVAAHNDLVSALHLARGEAIARMEPATVCRSNSGTACDGTEWEDGWIVFHDEDRDGIVDAGDDTIVRGWPALPMTLTLRSNMGGRVTFNEQGAALNAGTLTVCDIRDESSDADAREKHASAIILSPAGRIRNAIDTDSSPDGIVDNGSDNNVSCP
jgi:type IV fimbrial biogenesis protein FimT